MAAKMALRSTQMTFGQIGDAADDHLALREPGLNRILEELLSTGHRHRWQEFSVGAVGDSFFRARDADELLHPIVVRRKLSVAQRPILPKSVAACGLEVIVGKAQAPARPADRLAANLAPSNPHKWLVLRCGVR